jgi:hypothetical protein
VSTEVPIDFAKNSQLEQPGTSRTTSKSGAETQSGSNVELDSSGKKISNVVGENKDREQGVGVEKMGQDLEECNLRVEFPMIERQF